MTDSPEKKSPLQKLYDKISQKLEKKEDTADLRAQMGSVCLELGKRDEALLHLCRALELDPNMEYVRVNYNQILLDPRPEIEKVQSFLEVRMSPDKMVGVIDNELYRQRAD